MPSLTDKEIEDIVEKVTERVIENVYTSVGRSVVTKFFWFIGVAAIGVVTYLAGVGHIKVG
jgi:cobalamin biosynthesis protein CobD/CbiB|tara:strand:+ start:996 stop:1178 length:183 start_codon:yes stop_codon:yes gene_type:complete